MNHKLYLQDYKRFTFEQIEFTSPNLLKCRIGFSGKGKGRRSVVSDSSRPRGLQPARLLCLWDFPVKPPAKKASFTKYDRQASKAKRQN